MSMVQLDLVRQEPNMDVYDVRLLGLLVGQARRHLDSAPCWVLDPLQGEVEYFSSTAAFMERLTP